MAEITKMFISWTKGKTAFATPENEAKYNDSIVFINAYNGEGECIYTHGTYFASLDALKSSLDGLKYISKVAVDGNVYSAGSKDSTISFKTADGGEQTITIDVQNGELVFGLDGSFVKRVNDASANADQAIKDLGTNDKANTTAFARIKEVEDTLSELVGDGESGSISGMISDAIDEFKESVDTSLGFIDSSISNLDSSVKGLDASVQALISKDASLDASVQALINKDASIDEQIEEINEELGNLADKDASLDASIKGLDASVKALISKDASLDASVQALISKDASIDEEIQALKDKDASLDASIKALESGKANLENGKIVASELPDFVMGQVLFGGTVDANGAVTASANYKSKYGNTTSVPAANTCEGVYFIATGEGEVSGVEYNTGDWVVSNGTEWVKIDNTDAVSSVAGLTGPIEASELAKKLSADGLDGELATKAELDKITGDIKVTADGDDYVNATVGADGRSVSVSATDKLTSAVERAENAVLEVKAGDGIAVTDGDTVTVALDASSKASLAKADSAVQTISGTTDFVEVAVSGTERTIDLAQSVKDSLDRADNAVLDVEGTAGEISVTGGDTVTVALDASVKTALGKANSAVQSASGEGYVDASVSNNNVNVAVEVANFEDDAPSGLVDYAGLMSKFGWQTI